MEIAGHHARIHIQQDHTAQCLEVESYQFFLACFLLSQPSGDSESATGFLLDLGQFDIAQKSWSACNPEEIELQSIKRNISVDRSRVRLDGCGFNIPHNVNCPRLTFN